MKITEFLRDIFGGKESVYITQKLEQTACQIAFEEFYIRMAINMIAGLVSKCEFRTYEQNKPIKSEEYYLWNVEANKNQAGSTFKQELVQKLLYSQEALVVERGGSLIIADSFDRDERVVQGDVFTNVTRGSFTFNGAFTSNDVLYFRCCDGGVRDLLSGTMAGYQKLLGMAVGKYKRAGGRKGVIHIDTNASGTKADKKAIDDLFNTRFKNYFEAENAVLSLNKGFDYLEIPGEGSKKSTSELNDIINIMDEALSRVAQAFNIPPAILRGDIADVDALTNNLLTFCVDPLCKIIGEEITRKRYGKDKCLSGAYLRVDTTCIQHIDVFHVAEKVDKLISNAMYSVDELREKAGDYALGTAWSRKHWMTKNYDGVESVKGGESG